MIIQLLLGSALIAITAIAAAMSWWGFGAGTGAQSSLGDPPAARAKADHCVVFGDALDIGDDDSGGLDLGCGVVVVADFCDF